VNAYTYDNAGHYLRKVVLDADPLVLGRFLMPANSTLVAPPSCGCEKQPRWVGGHWELVYNPQSPVRG